MTGLGHRWRAKATGRGNNQGPETLVKETRAQYLLAASRTHKALYPRHPPSGIPLSFTCRTAMLVEIPCTAKLSVRNPSRLILGEWRHMEDSPPQQLAGSTRQIRSVRHATWSGVRGYQGRR